ncbi:MAG TPA: MbnP family protein [Chitinophagaceae bacterium]|nr:MbnP family protein [Chitinophagaceae bacterium]
MKNHLILPMLLMLAAFACSSCSKEYSASGFSKATPKEDSFNLTIRFTPMVDTVRLSFDSSYRNFWKEEYRVSSFKFYVSNFNLINTDSGRTYHLDSAKYFLIDAADSTTWTVKLLAKPFIYNRINFMIGIDSAHNVYNNKKDALDPAKGMFWSTTDGYIMAKLQGTAKNGNAFDYQIGGFTGLYNVLRQPTLLFPFGQYLQISGTAGSKSSIDIDANANAWFFNPHQVKIATRPSCTQPGLLAQDISENYSKMFSIRSVSNN